MAAAVITDLESALKAIIKHLGPENVEGVKRIDKSALIETTKQHYYFKFDSKPWFNAGYEVKKFSGAGFAINADIFKTLDSYRADILYCTLPNTVYEFDIDNFRKNSYKHTQKFNNEKVLVISLYQANGVFYI
jgi:hypothetical protein